MVTYQCVMNVVNYACIRLTTVIVILFEVGQKLI